MEKDLKKYFNESKSLSDLSRKIFGNNIYTNREKCKKILKDNNIDWEEWLISKKEKPKKYCFYCGKELSDNRKKFCNHSCSASYNNKKVVRNGKKKENVSCLYCGKPLTYNQKKFCSHDCEKKQKYETKIKEWKEGKIKGCDVNGEIATYVRKYMIEKKEYKCESCGFDKPNPYTKLSILQIHHIDGDCSNNNEENLQVLCPTCHALTENFGSRNTKSSRINRYRKK